MVQPLTPAERQRRSRALKKGLPDPFAGRETRVELIEARRSQHEEDLAWALEQDATGRYYGDECRSCFDLLGMYEGADRTAEALEDAEEVVKKKKQKKISVVPASLNLQIRAITRTQKLGDGSLEIELPIEPDETEYKNLFEVNEIVSFRRWLDLRGKGRKGKNLLWLGRLVGKDLYHSIHQVVCDQFVQKDFTGLYFPGYTLGDFHNAIKKQQRFANDGTPCREAMILDFRGAYKSTIDGIDSVQWLINAPDIRIMIITGENSLAVTFLQEIKAYFGIAEGAEPTAFNILYPEYVITGTAVSSTRPLICPAKVLKQKGKNLWVNSIVASLSGWHPDIKKGDDVVTDENSNTKETRAKLKKKYDGTKNTVPSYGFSEHIGTRYFTDDWYGTRMLPDKKTGKVSPIKYFCRGAWTVKPEYRSIPLKELTEEMVVLTAPQISSWEHLQSLLGDGERGFRNQQLNEPSDEDEDSPWVHHFTEALLRGVTHPKEMEPKDGKIFQTCDLSYTDKASSDYSVIVTGKIYLTPSNEYGLWILDIQYGKWKSSEIPTQLCMAYRKWPMVEEICIEKCNGAEWLYDGIGVHGQKWNVPDIKNKIKLWPIDASSGAKRNRIKDLEFLMSEGRLNISNGPYIDDTYKQFLQFTGERSTPYRKDDIPDGISFFINYLPKTALRSNADPEEVRKEMEAMQAKANLKAWKERIFGMSKTDPDYNRADASPKVSDWNRNRNGGGTPPTAPPPAEPQRDPRRAMLDKILPPGMRT